MGSTFGIGSRRKQIKPKIRWKIYVRDNFICQICKQDFRFNTQLLTIDHIIPLKNLGKNTQDNLQTACYSCNQEKSKYE